jgi:4a-hydroxytetrahydrobiopterin dehydratase
VLNTVYYSNIVKTTAVVPWFLSALAYALPMAKISSDDARQKLQNLPGWTLEGDTVKRQFTFSGFPEAVAFLVRLGFAAEAVDHHPDLLVNYKRVTVAYSTHSEGGLTDKDFAGAKEAATLATSMGAK